MKAEANEADERLLVEAARRDPSRFAELYELHFEHVYAFVLGRVKNREQAEDITAEAFEQALANLGKFEWRGVPFSAWLLRIAANATADRWRQSAREQGNPGHESAKTLDIEASGDRTRLFRLVRELPAEQRLVIEMRFAEEKSIREIAQALGKTEGAIKQLQFRGIQNLRERMEAKAPRKPGKRNG